MGRPRTFEAGSATWAGGRPGGLRGPGHDHDRLDLALRTQLVERLRAEFGDRVAAEDIGRVVDREIASFAGARVRSFVSILAWRRARDSLGRPDREQRSAWMPVVPLGHDSGVVVAPADLGRAPEALGPHPTPPDRQGEGEHEGDRPVDDDPDRDAVAPTVGLARAASAPPELAIGYVIDAALEAIDGDGGA